MSKRRDIRGKSRRNDFLDVLPASKHRLHVGKALAEVEGVYLTGAFQGTVAVGKAKANLTLAANDTITIRAAAVWPTSSVTALEAASRYPGNLRLARNASGGALIADTQVDGVTHLPRSIGSIRQAMTAVLRGKPACESVPAPGLVDRHAVVEALAGLSWSDDGVVEQEGGWELRPRLHGEVTPIVMTIEPEGLRLSRTLLPPQPIPGTEAAQAAADRTAQAVADRAARANASLRHARFALSRGRLVAEARLDTGLITPSWIESTARAVATAARREGTSLRLLAQQPAVADTYIMMFCSSGGQPTHTGVGG